MLQSTYAQPKPVPLGTLFTADQLDGETKIWRIAQAGDGQMIAGGERLAFYDGLQWKCIPSFQRLVVRSLLVDGNTLWVSTENDLGRLRLPLNSSSRFEPVEVDELKLAGQIWDLRRTDDRIVAVTLQEVLLVPRDGGHAERFLLPNSKRLMAQSWTNRVIVVQPGQAIWEVAGDRLIPFENPLPDKSDTEWHGSDGSFVFTSRALYVKSSDGWTERASTEDFTNQDLITSVVRWEDRVAAVSYRHGVALFDLKTGEKQVINRIADLDNPELLCAFADRNDRLWVGMTKGMALLESPRFGHQIPTLEAPLLASREGGLLLGFAQRTDFWPEGGKPVSIPYSPWMVRSTRAGLAIGYLGALRVGDTTINLEGNEIRDIVELPDGSLIVSMGVRVSRVDLRLGKVSAVSIPSTEISSLAVQGDSLWASGSNGLLYRSTLGDSLRFEPVVAFPSSGEPKIKNLDDTLIFTMTNGVVYGTNFYSVIHTEGLREAHMAENSDGLWLVGKQGGVQRLGKLVRKGDIIEWDTVEAKGLSPLTEIRSLHGHGRLLTVCGDSRVIELFTDQLKPAYRLESPRLVFSYYDPRKRSVITGATPPQELAAEENGLSFSGVLPFDEFGERPRYERRLRPSETAWQTTKAGETVSYPSLSSRSYTLEVRATHLGQTGPVAAYTFTILPPWYATVPALIAYAVVAALTFYVLYRLRTHQLHRRTAELERIVERRTLELKKASAAKSEFLASMSHEIRNPMNGVIGLVEILREQPASPRQADTLRLLQHCADQLRTTVDDILDFSKIEAGRIELECQSFDLWDALEAAAASVDPSGEKVEFVEMPKRGTRLVGDLGKIRQIFANYLTNALKYGVPPGARVSAVLSEENEELELVLSVASLGPTIPKETLDCFFESFTRGRDAMDRNIRGAGLGLAICRRYAQAMGGEVGAVSANGETTFYLNVPVSRADAEVQTFIAPAPDSSLPVRALAIEDEGYNRIVLGSILAKMNYTVDWATTGEEALRLARENGYDVIFTDYRLPDTNGVDLTRKILEGCSDPTPAVFAVTAYTTKERRDECLNAGMSGFISKPITLEKLRSTLAAWGEGKLATISLETARRPSTPGASPRPSELLSKPEPTPSTEIVSTWEELERLSELNPKRAAFLAHRLNNLCRARGLIDAAEQLELLEGALERGESPAPFLRACESFLGTPTAGGRSS